MSKEPMTLNIDEDVIKEFKKRCIDNDVNYSDAVEELMKEYIKRK